MFEFGFFESAVSFAVFSLQEFSIDEKSKAFVKVHSLAFGVGRILFEPGVLHGEKAQVVEFLQCGFGHHFSFFLSLLIRFGATNEIVTGSGGWLLIERKRLRFPFVFQDSLDVLVRASARFECALARLVQAVFAIALLQTHDAQTRAIALFGMRPLYQKTFDQKGDVGAELLRPRNQPRRTPLGVPAMGLRHVRTVRRVPPFVETSRMGGDAFAFVENSTVSAVTLASTVFRRALGTE